MSHIGRLEGYGVGKEATRGTAVNPELWVEHSSASFQDEQDNIQDESALHNLMNTSESDKTKQYAEGELEGWLATKSVGYFLLSLLGQVTSTENGSTGSYNHAFSMLESNSKPSLTISKKTPIENKKFALAMVSALGISATAGEAVMMKAELRSKTAEAGGTLTPAYTLDAKLLAKHVSIKFDDVGGNFSGAIAECFESIEINLTQELEDGFCFASGVDLGDIYNKGFSIDITATKVKKGNTYEQYMKNSTKKALQVAIIDDSKTVGSGSDNPGLTFDVAKVSFEDYTDDGGLDDIMRETITMKGHYDLANAKSIDALLVNDKASY